jgi:hypothetical protein
MIPANIENKIAKNSTSGNIPVISFSSYLTETIAPLVPKENKKIQIAKELPKKHKQENVKTESKIIPQTEDQTVLSDKQIVIVDRIEGNVVVIEYPDRTTKDIALNELPSGITRSDALILDNGIYTISLEETNKRKAIIAELMNNMWS